MSTERPSGLRPGPDGSFEREDGRPWAVFADDYGHVAQLMPGAGWRAVFGLASDIHQVELIAWALMVDPTGFQHLQGIAPSAEGDVFCCEDVANFCFYAGPSESWEAARARAVVRNLTVEAEIPAARGERDARLG